MKSWQWLFAAGAAIFATSCRLPLEPDRQNVDVIVSRLSLLHLTLGVSINGDLQADNLSDSASERHFSPEIKVSEQFNRYGIGQVYCGSVTVSTVIIESGLRSQPKTAYVCTDNSQGQANYFTFGPSDFPGLLVMDRDTIAYVPSGWTPTSRADSVFWTEAQRRVGPHFSIVRGESALQGIDGGTRLPILRVESVFPDIVPSHRQ